MVCNEIFRSHFGTYQKNIRQVSIKKAKNTTNKIANAKYTSIFSKRFFVITYEPCFHEQVWFRNWQCLPCCYQLVINANVNLIFFSWKTLVHCVWLKIWKKLFRACSANACILIMRKKPVYPENGVGPFKPSCLVSFSYWPFHIYRFHVGRIFQKVRGIEERRLRGESH